MLIIYNATNVIHLNKRCELRVRLPTKLQNGNAILNYKQFCKGVRMPSALVTCKDGYATTVIQNTLDTELTLTITSPFIVTK